MLTYHHQDKDASLARFTKVDVLNLPFLHGKADYFAFLSLLVSFFCFRYTAAFVLYAFSTAAVETCLTFSYTSGAGQWPIVTGCCQVPGVSVKRCIAQHEHVCLSAFPR